MPEDILFLTGNSKKLLLHICCAPCAVKCVETLCAEGLKPDLYWYNPNIHPAGEHSARLSSAKAFADGQNLAFIEEPYSPGDYYEAIGGADSRCFECYTLRLEKTAEYAAKNSYGTFTTTLLISPYQSHETLIAAGKAAGDKYGVEFMYRDFRPYFRQGREEARRAGYYMQKYCGCSYSAMEKLTAR